MVVHPGAGAYICGEETALLESLEGKRGFPRIKPPYFPAAIGLYGQPTVVNNVETMSNLPWIVNHGGARPSPPSARAARPGPGSSPCPGHVRNPGVYEVEMVKTTFRDLIYAPVLGGGIPGGRELKAFIPGGVSAPWFGPDQVDLPLGQDEVAEAGSMLGSGSIVVMDTSTCVVRAAWRITRFFFRESCGQCTPCREGAGWLERILCRIEHGEGREEDLDLLMDVCDNISPGVTWPPQQTTICVLGPSIPSVDHLGHLDVPRRVPRPHQRRACPMADQPSSRRATASPPVARPEATARRPSPSTAGGVRRPQHGRAAHRGARRAGRDASSPGSATTRG